MYRSVEDVFRSKQGNGSDCLDLDRSGVSSNPPKL